MTFDAFAKSLLDRFRLCLPPEHRPIGDYDLIKVPNVSGQTVLEAHRSASEVTKEAGLDFESRVLGPHRLSDSDRPRGPAR
jgi:hypothetical protein